MLCVTLLDGRKTTIYQWINLLIGSGYWCSSYSNCYYSGHKWRSEIGNINKSKW
jgi:hypothetical protein